MQPIYSFKAIHGRLDVGTNPREFSLATGSRTNLSMNVSLTVSRTRLLLVQRREPSKSINFKSHSAVNVIGLVQRMGNFKETTKYLSKSHAIVQKSFTIYNFLIICQKTIETPLQSPPNRADGDEIPSTASSAQSGASEEAGPANEGLHCLGLDDLGRALAEAKMQKCVGSRSGLLVFKRRIQRRKLPTHHSSNYALSQFNINENV